VKKAFYDAGYTSAYDCGVFLLSHDLVDRDLGGQKWDDSMKTFINSHLTTDAQCNSNQCLDKRDILKQIDVDNWLRNFAVYAVVLVQDSPMGNGNNYYLATASDPTLKNPIWKIVQYDHNNDPETAANTLCDSSCLANGLDDWSVVRPTCKGLSENPLVGPILLDSELHARYIAYVREFTENIYTSESLLSDMREQYQAIANVAKNSPDFETYGSIDGSSLFDWMKRRGGKVLDQLDLWESGQFPEFASTGSEAPCVSLNTEYFSDKCTSPDGMGGHDCCASMDWGEPMTCALGYKVKKLNQYCQYTCVKGLSTGLIVGIVIAITVLVFLVIFAIKVHRRRIQRRNNPASKGEVP